MFWYYLKTPNLTFLNLVIPQHNISSNFGILNISYTSVPYFSFWTWLLCADVVWKHKHKTYMCAWVWSCHSKIFHRNFQCFLNRLCPIFSFLKVVLVNKYDKETIFLVPEPGQATLNYFIKFLKFLKFLKMDVSHKNAL